MQRPSIRTRKRAMTAGSRERADGTAVALARELALPLLGRSVGMGHHRLARIRPLEARVAVRVEYGGVRVLRLTALLNPDACEGHGPVRVFRGSRGGMKPVTRDAH
jgi:hypothetical protein